MEALDEKDCTAHDPTYYLLFESRVSASGVISIPSKIRQELGLSRGETLKVGVLVEVGILNPKRRIYLTITAPLQLNGVVSIPKRIREHLGLEPEDDIEGRVRVA